MPIMQSYNKKIKAYVKFKKTSKGTKIMNVKQQDPGKPFKGIPIKKRK